jgi:hypothetical protein
MVARTTTRETTNTATMNAAHELGAHLFQMTEHFPTCKICAPRQGRIYRDADFPDGDERNRFPQIAMAFPGWPRYRTVHPNCRHVLVAVGWGNLTREEQEAYLAGAGKPFNLDPRSEREIAAYNKGQALRREMREDRKQYGRMKERLGDDAPKSFSAFRRMKKAGGDRWEKTLLDYQRRSRLVDDPLLALPGAEQAQINDRKFTHYLFGGVHTGGLSKGVAFSSHLGYNKDNWGAMKDEILQKATIYPATLKIVTEYGPKYNQAMILYGLKHNPMDVVVAWEINDGIPRFITVHPNHKGGKVDVSRA